MMEYRLTKDHAIVLLDDVLIQGNRFSVENSHPLLKVNASLGLLTASTVEAQRIKIDDFVCHPRVVKTAAGDYLLFYAAGDMHYAWAKGKNANDMFMRRSKDCWHWSEPVKPWEVPYSHHVAIPFIPEGSSDLYAFGTEPAPDCSDGEENATIGFRVSRDHGVTWSEVNFIEPMEDPTFVGMASMRMCETGDGAWLLGSHSATWGGEEEVNRTVITEQYVLRSADRGETWSILPGPRPEGWFIENHHRMDEGCPIYLGGNEVLLMVRTPAGHLWELRSYDNGLTWEGPVPTVLEHPDAPPMIFKVEGDKLVCLYHRRKVTGKFSQESRTELWITVSDDKGHTWSEPRFILTNACEPAILNSWGGWTPMVSYADAILADDGYFNIFIDHQMRQVVQARFRWSELDKLPTISDLGVRRKRSAI